MNSSFEWDKPQDSDMAWDLPVIDLWDADVPEDGDETAPDKEYTKFTKGESAHEMLACLVEVYLANERLSAKKLSIICFWAKMAGQVNKHIVYLGRPTFICPTIEVYIQAIHTSELKATDVRHSQV